MEFSFNTLSLLAEVLIAFVAFAAIVSSLRVSFGEALTDFQKLLVQFFTVSGLIGTSIVLLPFVLAEFWDEEQTIAQFTFLYILATSGVYLFWYLWNRIKIGAPTPLVSALVMIGYFLWLPILILMALGVVLKPSLGVVVAYGFWVLITSVAIFIFFLYEFIHPGDSES